MPDQETLDLIALGPFEGIDTRQAGPYASPRSGVIVSSADTHRLGGALLTGLGRLPFQQFLNLGQGNDAAQVAVFVVSPDRAIYIVQDAAGRSVYYDSKAEIFGSLGDLSPFTQAVQSNGTLWLNNGQQVFFGPSNAPEVALWQYPRPNANEYAYSATLGPQGQGNLQPGRYSYAFVQVISIQNAASTIKQSTTAQGDIPRGQHADGSTIYDYQVTVPDTPNKPGYAITIDGTFAGNTADGYPFVTDVYRYSTNSPQWFLLTTLHTNGEYIDTASDASISGNQQIIPNQDPPQTGSPNNYPDNFIAAHQDRMWTLAIVQNSDTNNVPQTQVGYSRPGEPWSFDKVNQTLLVEDEQTTILQSHTLPVPYGDTPVGLCPLGSSVMVFRRMTTSMIYGVNEVTYQPVKVFADIGCIAWASIVRANALVFWLSAEGVYSFDGSSLQWISEAITNDLQAIGTAALNAAVGYYKDFSYCLAFPGAGVTYKFYIPSRQWSSKPHVTPSVFFSTSMPSDLTTNPLSMNQVVAVRPTSQWIDFLEADYQDLGTPIVLTFKSQETDMVSGTNAPQWQKQYTKILVEAPIQPGVKCDLSLWVNGILVKTWEKIDLGSGTQVTRILNVPEGTRGYTAQVQVTLYNAPNATQSAVIYAVKLGGQAGRAWVASNAA